MGLPIRPNAQLPNLSINKVSSHLSSYSPFSYCLFHFTIIGETFVSIRSRWAGNLEIRLPSRLRYGEVIVSKHSVPYPTFLFEYSLLDVKVVLQRFETYNAELKAGNHVPRFMGHLEPQDGLQMR